jgi:cysteine desulfurase
MSTTKRPIYLDYAATTPLLPEALEAMRPYLEADYGNPASVHGFGQRAEAALESARETMARHLNASPSEIVFTSGATESDNLALRGAAWAAFRQGGARHILTTPVEHDAVSQTAEQLATLHDFELEYLPVDEYGRVAPADLAARLRPETALVSAIYANNEIGTLNPIAELVAVCREHGVTFHTDAVQAGAHLALNVKALGVDLLTLGAHKFGGPKGAGILYVRDGVEIMPMQTGGGHEGGLRAGTANVAYLVGMAAAFDLTQSDVDQSTSRLVDLRDRVIDTTLDSIPHSRLTGHPTERLPNHASFVFKGVDGNALLMLLDAAGFACSSGSACKTGDPEPSEVLNALGFSREWGLGSLRVTLGRQTTEDEVGAFLAALPELVVKCRALEIA